MLNNFWSTFKATKLVVIIWWWLTFGDLIVLESCQIVLLSLLIYYNTTSEVYLCYTSGHNLYVLILITAYSYSYLYLRMFNPYFIIHRKIWILMWNRLSNLYLIGFHAIGPLRNAEIVQEFHRNQFILTGKTYKNRFLRSKEGHSFAERKKKRCAEGWFLSSRSLDQNIWCATYTL